MSKIENDNKKLSKFDITEIIYSTGVKKFTDEDLKFWGGKDPLEFLGLYVDDPQNKIERTGNTLQLFYNGKDFDNNVKSLFFGDDVNFGRMELSRAPLYDKNTNKKIGIAQFVCSESTFENEKYITCESTYFLNKELIPDQILSANGESLLNNDFASINFTCSYISRGEGTFFTPGDFFASKGKYFLENGLNRTNALINVFLPLNSEDLRRSIVINLDTVESNNFLPQNNYGFD